MLIEMNVRATGIPMNKKAVDPPNISQAAICQLFISQALDSKKQKPCITKH
jgi:hypothetical protein